MLTEHFKKGETIFREGDESREAYFIVSGTVELSLRASSAPDGIQSLATIGDGEIFGEMGMITDRPRSATATAVEDTMVETIGNEDFEQQILQRPERLRVYLATLYERIRSTDLLLNPAEGVHTPPKARATEASSQPPGLRAVLRSHYDETGFKHEPVFMEIGNLPFRIGRAHFNVTTSAATRNALSIKEGIACQLSPQHCEIDLEDGVFILRDSGSRQGSWVNGKQVSERAGCLSCPLELGDNEIIFGRRQSPHRYTLTIEEVG